LERPCAARRTTATSRSLSPAGHCRQGGIHRVGIEPAGARLGAQRLRGRMRGVGRAVGPALGQRVVDVCCGQHPRGHREHRRQNPKEAHMSSIDDVSVSIQTASRSNPRRPPLEEAILRGGYPHQ
jgi:hypothetical protein